MKNKIYGILLLAVIAFLWQAPPVDAAMHKSAENSATLRIIFYVFETTWLKVTVSIFLGLIALSLSKGPSSK